MREVAQEAIARARRGDGPTLIEAETYRFRGHSLADPDELRKKEEKDHYQVQEQLSDVCTMHWRPLSDFTGGQLSKWQHLGDPQVL